MIATLKRVEHIDVEKDLITLKLVWDEDEPIFPGQFFMIGTEEVAKYDFLLNRPFSVANFENNILEFKIRITGRFTKFLSKINIGDFLRIIGPLGRYLSFDFFSKFEHVLLLGGGIGVAPLIYFYNFLMKKKVKCSLYYGCKDKSFLHYIRGLEDKIFIFSEDGSYGEKGFVTDVLKRDFSKSLVVACGPLQMYNALKKYSKKYEIKVLLEEKMACGFGVCLGCAVDTVDGYKRVCKEGPIFDLNFLKI